MAERDLYEILDVDPDADPETIKRAYRRQAQLWHPDRHPKQPEINRRFKAISEAYTILINPQTRQKYDQLRRSQLPGRGERLRELLNKSSSGINSIFDTIFGPDLPYGQLHAGRELNGGHVHTAVRVPLLVAAFGGERQIAITRAETCPNCRGRGFPPGQTASTCVKCGGSGRIAELQGLVRHNCVCPDCAGRGLVAQNSCVVCNGKGRTARKKKLNLRIPPGIRDGESIRLRNEGEEGLNGGAPGDLLVRVSIEPDQRFQRAGNDLVTEVELDLAQALLGATLALTGLDGKPLELNVPPGVQPGAELTIPGAGLLISGSAHRGKLIVKIKVRIPQQLTPEQRAAFLRYWDEMTR